MNDEHDTRRTPGHRERATESLPAMAIAASASASLSIVDIPKIVRRRAHASPRDAASSGLVDVGELCFGEGLSRAPITPLLPIAADPAPVRPVDHERTLLWSMTAAAAIAVAAMFAVVVGQTPAPVIIRAPAEPAPVMAAASERDDDDRERPVHDRGEVVAPSSDDDELEDAPSDAAPTELQTRDTAKPKAPSKPSNAATKPAITPKPPREPAPAPKGETSVECVLDPASCGLGGAKAEPVSPPVAAPESLPSKLGTTALRAVLGPAKSAAQACGPRHGAESGTQVQVKLSIAGATGRVQSAAALGDHAGTALGKCVADALATPVFPRFSASQQGVVWPIRL
jgi:hypothetical protein